MKTKPSFEERFWWLPLGRRVYGWAVAMGWQWGRIPFLLGNIVLALGGLAIWSSWLTHPLQNKTSFGLMVILLSIYGVTLLLGAAGGLTGAVVGYYAPACEPSDPFQSAFFRKVGKRTFLTWSYLSALFIPAMIALGQWMPKVQPLMTYLLLIGALLVLCIWCAKSVALRSPARISID